MLSFLDDCESVVVGMDGAIFLFTVLLWCIVCVKLCCENMRNLMTFYWVEKKTMSLNWMYVQKSTKQMAEVILHSVGVWRDRLSE
jgi:hypothetical protein